MENKLFADFDKFSMFHYNSIVSIVEHCADDIYDITNMEGNDMEIWSEICNRLYIFGLEIITMK